MLSSNLCARGNIAKDAALTPAGPCFLGQNVQFTSPVETGFRCQISPLSQPTVTAFIQNRFKLESPIPRSAFIQNHYILRLQMVLWQGVKPLTLSKRI